jgi:cation diffusion facilitator family transporter
MDFDKNYKSPEASHESIKDQRNAALISLIVGTTLLILKFWAFNVTGSNSVFSDAMESIVNVFAAIVLIFVIYYSNRPADKDHPYGHGKIEYFSAAFEGGLISFAALMIIIDSVSELIKGYSIKNLDFGLVIVAVAGVINLALGYFLVRVGERRGSTALVASGKHVISDFWTSFGILLGLVVVKATGFIWLDSVMAIIVGLLLAKTGIKVVKDSIGGLMDEEDEQAIKLVAETFSKHISESVIQIHNLKMIRSGQYHHIDAHLVVPEFWDVAAVHENIDRFERRVMKDYPYNLELHFHLDPCRKVYCDFCDVKDCPIREKTFVKRLPLLMDHLTSPEEPAELKDPHEYDEQPAQ